MSARSALAAACGALLALGLAACAGVEPIVACEVVDGVRPVCGFQRPEDLAVLPDGTLLISQMGTMDGAEPGSLVHFDPDGETLRPVFPPGGIGAEPDAAAIGARPGWGAGDCPGPPGPAFSPHGIDLSRRPDGALQLLVVNHGGREAVEFFEVDGDRVVWRGCAVPEAPHFLNDVAALPGGGFVVTHMFPKSTGLGGLYHFLRSVVGLDTGYVLEWSTDAGFRPLEGSAGAMPNGVAASPDGRYVFENVYMAGEVRRIARDGSEPVATVAIASPDNVSWSDDGQLLVASHTESGPALMACGSIERGACPTAFAIVALDPASLATRVVFETDGNPMGAGTAAVVRGGELFVGTFAGDRIIRAPLAR